MRQYWRRDPDKGRCVPPLSKPFTRNRDLRENGSSHPALHTLEEAYYEAPVQGKGSVSRLRFRKFTKKQRDEWFSQVWTVTGARQTHGGLERRVAAFPEEIPRRLIRMFSIESDLVVDPFLGSGTTLKAAMDLGRRFIGYERLGDFSEIIKERIGPDSKRIVFQKRSAAEQFSELTA